MTSTRAGRRTAARELAGIIMVAPDRRKGSERLLAQAFADLDADYDHLVEGIDKALHELGIPGPGYPAPVANAVDILRALIDPATPPQFANLFVPATPRSLSKESLMPEPLTDEEWNLIRTDPMTDQPVPAATLDYTPLTDDEEAVLRASIEDLARFPAHTDWVNTIASLFGSLDAARSLAPAPTAPAGLREFFRDHGWSIHMDDRPGQPLHPFDVLAAIASPSEEPGLDVERLAEAVHVMVEQAWGGKGASHAHQWCLDEATEVAAEYARLAKGDA